MVCSEILSRLLYTYLHPQLGADGRSWWSQWVVMAACHCCSDEGYDRLVVVLPFKVLWRSLCNLIDTEIGNSDLFRCSRTRFGAVQSGFRKSVQIWRNKSSLPFFPIPSNNRSPSTSGHPSFYFPKKNESLFGTCPRFALRTDYWLPQLFIS